MQGWPALFRPHARYARDWSGDVVVLAPGPIPTVDYYLTPRLRVLPEGAVRHFDSRAFDPTAEALPRGAFIVIVRYAARTWLRFLARHRSRWSGAAYLMDDDVPAAWSCRELPWTYAAWTTGRYLWTCRLLAEVCDRIWFSTASLQSRYAGRRGRVLEPMEPFPPRLAAPQGTRRWGYHGTRTHEREMRWLVPVVEKVQAASPEHQFEIFGDARVARWFAHVPRACVLPPRPWPEFVAHCRASGLAVGVAPLLPGRFNAVRSQVKIFDIARCGAVGVLSRRAPYAPALAGAGAALLPDDREAWVSEIVRLLQDDALRLARYAETSAWVAAAGRGSDIAGMIREGVA